MDNKKIAEMLNEQYNFEISSAYVYFGIMAYFTNSGWDGFSAFMKKQAQEEMEHALKIYDFMADRGYSISHEAISAPKNEYASIVDAFEASLAHEKIVTSRIHDLYRASNEEGDFATAEMIRWFISEQVEEEATMQKIVDNLKKMKDSYSALYLYDKELGARQ